MSLQFNRITNNNSIDKAINVLIYTVILKMMVCLNSQTFY